VPTSPLGLAEKGNREKRGTGDHTIDRRGAARLYWSYPSHPGFRKPPPQKLTWRRECKRRKDRSVDDADWLQQTHFCFETGAWWYSGWTPLPNQRVGDPSAAAYCL